MHPDNNNDDEWEWVEETQYMVMDFKSALTKEEILAAAKGGYRLVGLDTPTPYFELGNNIFQGTVTDSMRDELIFTIKDSQHATNNVDSADDHEQATLEHVATTSRKIVWERISLAQKEDTRGRGGKVGEGEEGEEEEEYEEYDDDDEGEEGGQEEGKEQRQEQEQGQEQEQEQEQDQMIVDTTATPDAA